MVTTCATTTILSCGYREIAALTQTQANLIIPMSWGLVPSTPGPPTTGPPLVTSMVSHVFPTVSHHHVVHSPRPRMVVDIRASFFCFFLFCLWARTGVCECSTHASYHVLYGALVGGPLEDDTYFDKCPDFVKDEGES